MNKDSRNVLLKIFSGPHIGAEVSLKPGKYTIGQDDSCDIILHDKQIEGQHAILEVASDGRQDNIRIKPLNQQNLAVNGKLLSSDQQQSVKHYSVITLGTTHLAIGENQGEWSKVKVPKINNHRHSATDQNGTMDRVSAGVRSIPLFDNPFVSDTIHHISRGIERAGASISNYRRDSSLKTVSKVFGIFIIGAGLLTLGSTWYKIQRGYDAASSRILLSPKMVVGHLSLAGFSDVNATAIADKQILITGYVDDESAYRNLKDEIEDISSSNEIIEITEDVQVGSALAARVNELLQQLGLQNLNVSYQAEGIVRVQGYHASNSEWENVSAMILNDLPRLKSLQNMGIDDVQTRKKEFQERLANTPLKEKVSLQVIGDQIVASAILSRQERAKLESIRKVFFEKYGSLPKITLEVTDSLKAIPIEIRSVRGGSVPYVTTKDGKRFMQGAFLPNGFTLKAIHHDRIVMSKNDIEVVYPLN